MTRSLNGRLDGQMSGNPLTRAIVGAITGVRQGITTKQMEHGVDFLETMARGIGRFRQDVFPQRREQFESLADAQQPKALFLTCADSRIVPSMITQTGPGELFIERNPGNIAPVYSGEAVGVSASIEYAISALRTPHVIICGSERWRN